MKEHTFDALKGLEHDTDPVQTKVKWDIYQFMATAKILVCEQFNLFSQITLVGVLIILSSLILLELFLLRWLHKLRELGDYFAFTMIKLRILFASTPITFRLGLVENIVHLPQFCSVRSINKVHKSLQIL
ncbi:Hypothetical_protein [Hexamita inflata]|uniref:Hypothetical_protein n=1 Tax=Hexamita inflata TaxID=28002 RepID=A0ABP1GS09_9EUKA